MWRKEHRDCLMSHLGTWLIEPGFARSALAQFRAGALPELDVVESRRRQEGGFVVTGKGVAVIPILGSMAKGFGKFTDTSTVLARRQIREAARDESVKGIMLSIDSPGGRFAGTFELAEEVLKARERKPVRAHIDDLGASAAFFVASQAERITVNRPGEVGSIGTVGVLVDSSGKAEAEGLKVHVVSTGPFKGAFADGTPITEAHLEFAQERVNEANKFFLEAVSRGRGLEGGRLEAVSDGRVFGSQEAVGLGLVDQVQSADEAMASFEASLASDESSRLDQVRMDLVGAGIEG